jgi:alkylated DNA repair dioxygenase AlkB
LIVGATVEASATMEMTMTILEKLSFSDKTRAAMLTSPEVKLRGKMLDALDLQIAAAEAMLNGETFVRRVMRWVDDPETGERVRKEVPVRYRTWFWKDEQGSFMLDIRYGNRRL